MQKRNGWTATVLLMTLLAMVGAGAGVEKRRTDRPFIWVDKTERAVILEKIESNEWAKSVFEQMKQGVDENIKEYDKDVDAYLRKLPFDWASAKEGAYPQFPYITDSTSEREVRYPVMHFLQSGIESGILHFLTGEEKYGQFSLDILHAVVEAMVHMKLGTGHNGGYVFSKDHLKEARVFGAQIPILYDFCKPFIDGGGKPYSLVSKGKVDFNGAHAQKVFENYVFLALNRGSNSNNWPILEGASLIHNVLALEDLKLRKKYLDVILIKGTRNQSSIKQAARRLDNPSGIWPESLNYAGGVCSGLTYHMAVLTKYNPSWMLAQKYAHVPMAMSRTERLRYPNGDLIAFGDGHRHGGVSMGLAELVYFIGGNQGLPQAKTFAGDLLTTRIKDGRYDRSKYYGRQMGASWWISPLQLLWNEPTIEGTYRKRSAPYRTDDLPFAGIYLQRNLSSTGNSSDDLMCFVGGAAFVHGHASGMNMELYGAGEVLGAKGGRDKYGSDIHENYYRLFAGHNTVIVNGASRGEGGWAGLRINKVKLEKMEPMPRQPAVSLNHSFTLTSFRDDGGNKAEADQQRLMAIVRTSPTSGYYVDVYRSKSDLPDQFHDYLYHGIADRIAVNGKDITFDATPDRYKGDAAKEWKRNRVALNPGWHFFENCATAPCEEDLELVFPAVKLQNPASMRMFVLGQSGRELTMALAPKTSEAPKPYDGKDAKTPTAVIRQKGEAWNRPFAVVYEPVKNAEGNGTLLSVKELVSGGLFCGFEVVGAIGGVTMKQLVLIPNGNPIEIPELKLMFEGTYAVVSERDGKLDSIYIGEGRRLRFGTVELAATETNAILKQY